MIPDLVMSGALGHLSSLHVDWHLLAGWQDKEVLVLLLLILLLILLLPRLLLLLLPGQANEGGNRVLY